MRLRQGIRALSAWARPVDDDYATQVLSPPLMAIFREMRRSERQHSLQVLRTLQAQGHSHPALMVAALLHDVGKSRAPFHLWDRTIVVLVKAAAPRLARRLGKQEERPDSPLRLGWRRPFIVSFQHPRWGADMVAAAGADPLAVKLIAMHQVHLEHPPQDEFERLLVTLQSADDAN